MHVVPQLILAGPVIIVFLDQVAPQPSVAASHYFSLGMIHEMEACFTKAIKRREHLWIREQRLKRRHERLQGRLEEFVLDLLRI
jgi:hypothetical protein